MEQLLAEYQNSIIIQTDVISRYRDRLNDAKNRHNFKEARRLNSLLFILYEEKRELEQQLFEISCYLGKKSGS